MKAITVIKCNVYANSRQKTTSWGHPLENLSQLSSEKRSVYKYGDFMKVEQEKQKKYSIFNVLNESMLIYYLQTFRYPTLATMVMMESLDDVYFIRRNDITNTPRFL